MELYKDLCIWQRLISAQDVYTAGSQNYEVIINAAEKYTKWIDTPQSHEYVCTLVVAALMRRARV